MTEAGGMKGLARITKGLREPVPEPPQEPTSQTPEPPPQAEGARTEREPRSVGRPRVGKRSDSSYDRLAVLVKKETKRRAVRLLMDREPERDMSDLVERLLVRWINEGGDLPG